MIVLALDLAGKTGYAIHYDTGEVKVGVWNLVRGNIGGSRSPIPMIRLWRRLSKLAESHQIDRIAYEETFGRGAAKFRLDSLQYTALLFAMLARINWIRITPSAWKKQIAGNARASRAEYLQFAQQKWPDLGIKTDDQAAAMCILEYSLRQEWLESSS